MKSLAERDAQLLWHPYTQHQTADPAIGITHGKGSYLFDENGKRYIDAISSWWTCPFGHRNKKVTRAISKQLKTLEHVLFGGFTHQPAVELAEVLTEILPENQRKFFFSDNGSTAVEIALKAALQFYFNKGEIRPTIIAFEDAYHGDTFGAMGASSISIFSEAFQSMLIDVVRIPVPVKGQEEVSEQALKEIIENKKAAAFIFEPLVQGAAGMVMYEPEILTRLIAICKNAGVFTIADEVMTGFWKTGTIFASLQLGVSPDMICLSKALTSGTIPLAVTSFTDEIYNGFLSADKSKALFHGHTFTANPTGCAAALASIKQLRKGSTLNKVQKINQLHLAFAESLKHSTKVRDVRVKGVIIAIELNVPPQDYYSDLRNQLYRFFIENGVLLRPVGGTIYILPPFNIRKKDLEYVYLIVEEALEKFVN